MCPSRVGSGRSQIFEIRCSAACLHSVHEGTSGHWSAGVIHVERYITLERGQWKWHSQPPTTNQRDPESVRHDRAVHLNPFRR